MWSDLSCLDYLRLCASPDPLCEFIVLSERECVESVCVDADMGFEAEEVPREEQVQEPIALADAGDDAGEEAVAGRKCAAGWCAAFIE